MINYYVLLPQQIQQVYEKVQEYLPDRFRSLDYFVQLYLRKDSMFFEIGTFAGAFWLTDIHPGWKATAHIVIWDEVARHQAARARGVLNELCRMFRFKKISAYVPIHLEHAARFIEKIGFVVEGTEKLADYYDGQLVDFLLATFYKED